MDGQKRLYFTITFVKLRLSESASKTNYEHSRNEGVNLSNTLTNIPLRNVSHYLGGVLSILS